VVQAAVAAPPLVVARAARKLRVYRVGTARPAPTQAARALAERARALGTAESPPLSGCSLPRSSFGGGAGKRSRSPPASEKFADKMRRRLDGPACMAWQKCVAATVIGVRFSILPACS
jgi:hypothetical protein